MRSIENAARGLVAVPDHPANDLPATTKENRTQRVQRLSLEFRERLLLALIAKSVPEQAAESIVDLLVHAKARDRITLLTELLGHALPAGDGTREGGAPIVAIQVNGGLARGKAG